MPKKILMLCGDYAEDYETMVPFQALTMIGHTVHAVCPNKKAGEKIRTSIHDFALNASFASIDPGAYDALLIVGGRAPEYIRLERKVLDVVRHFADKKKPIAAICHGAQVLTAADAVRGRSLSAYPACAPEVRMAGGEYVDVPMDKAHVDGNLVTAPAWPAHPDWLAKFLVVLGTKITA